MKTIQKNRTQEIRVRQRDRDGRRSIDVRVFFLADDETMKPTTKGVSLDLDRADDLADAIRQVARQGHPDDD